MWLGILRSDSWDSSSPNEKMPSPESDTKVSKWNPRAEISPIFASAAHHDGFEITGGIFGVMRL